MDRRELINAAGSGKSDEGNGIEELLRQVETLLHQQRHGGEQQQSSSSGALQVPASREAAGVGLPAAPTANTSNITGSSNEEVSNQLLASLLNYGMPPASGTATESRVSQSLAGRDHSAQHVEGHRQQQPTQQGQLSYSSANLHEATAFLFRHLQQPQQTPYQQVVPLQSPATAPAGVWSSVAPSSGPQGPTSYPALSAISSTPSPAGPAGNTEMVSTFLRALAGVALALAGPTPITFGASGQPQQQLNVSLTTTAVRDAAAPLATAGQYPAQPSPPSADANALLALLGTALGAAFQTNTTANVTAAPPAGTERWPLTSAVADGNRLSTGLPRADDSSSLPIPTQQPQSNPIIRPSEAMIQHEGFAYKLYRMLQETEQAAYESIVSWMPNGTSWKIHDNRRFMSLVAPRYFQHSKLNSLKRQLHHYNFELIYEGPDAGAYWHEDFKRGHPELLPRVRRVR